MGTQCRRNLMPCLRLFLIGAAVFYMAVPAAVYFMPNARQGTVTSVGLSCMEARARHSLSFLPKAGVVCEIGPGRGVLAIEAEKQNRRYWAIDMDADVAANISAEKIFICRVPPLPEFTEAPTGIVIESVLEHMGSAEEVGELLAQAYDAIETDGVLVIRVPEIRHSKWRFWDSAPDHSYVTSTRRIAMLLRASGFNIIEHGCYLDQFTGFEARAVYCIKSLWAWGLFHNIFYEPWQESAFSKIAEKVPAAYICARRDTLKENIRQCR